MTSARHSKAEPAAGRGRRGTGNLAALLLGLPLAAAVLLAVHLGPLRQTPARRYLSHPVECVEVLLFGAAVGILAAKLWHNRAERRAFAADVLPGWDGRPVPVAEATTLLAGLNRLPQRLQNTFLVRRVAAALDFPCRRGSAAGLDDQLRALADADALAVENAGSLTRFITWAIPILGFLGTVLGITGAISGVTPEKLEHELSAVTDGLALAFDATALALGLTMVTMFLSHLVDRAEQATLEAVDGYADRHLAHRFERPGAGGGDVGEALRHNAQALAQTGEQLVRRQAEVWARALEEVDRRRAREDQARQGLLTGALEAALERTLQAHAQRLAQAEKHALEQGAALSQQIHALAERVAAQARALAQVQEGEKHLRRLQEVLNQNLAAVSAAGAFEQALHSLTAAVHLLTARAAPTAGHPKVAA